MDVVLAILFAGGLAYGFFRGFIRQLVSIITLFAAFFIAFKFNDEVADVLREWFPLSSVQTFERYEFMIKQTDLDMYLYTAAAFALIFFGVKIVLAFVGHFLHLFSKVPGIGFLNKWAGALLAGVEILAVMVIALYVMNGIPSDQVQELLRHSVLAHKLLNIFPLIQGQFDPVVETQI